MILRLKVKKQVQRKADANTDNDTENIRVEAVDSDFARQQVE